MKRFWIGILVLSLLLVLGGIVAFCMDTVHTQIAQLLLQAREASLADNWDAAVGMARQAQALWERHWHFTASFADHTPMDELDALFAELMVFSQEKEMPHFAAICAHLAQLAEAMADSHTSSWWNFL